MKIFPSFQAGLGLASRLEALVSYPHHARCTLLIQYCRNIFQLLHLQRAHDFFRSRSRGRRKCADLSCTCGGVGGGGGGGGGACGGGKQGCEQGKGENCAIVVKKEEEGGEDADDTKDEEESLNDNSKEEEENNNAEDQGEGSEISDLLPKEMMVFHPSMEDLVELIEESKVMEEKELAAQLHFVVSYFIRVTSKQTKK